jgi:hypothetical protein
MIRILSARTDPPYLADLTYLTDPTYLPYPP